LKIAIDAMGSDQAPTAEVLGAIDAAREWPIEIVLVGDETRIRAVVANAGGLPPNVTVVHASEVVTPAEEPTKAVRTKKDASIVVAARLVRDGAVDALLSAGSTGALVVVGTMVIGRIKGVERPALAPVFPTIGESVIVLDIGATPDPKPEYLVQWAVMGQIYAREILGRRDPKVALLNIGTEEEKGSALTKATYALLKEVPGLNFVGNIEGRDVPFGKVDVVVTDGFTGNVFLKTFEGVAMALMQAIKAAMTSSLMAKIGAMLVRPALRRMAKRFDYQQHGGVLLLGVKAPVVKCHGSSSQVAIKNGIRAMRDALLGRAVEKLSASFAVVDATTPDERKGP